MNAAEPRLRDVLEARLRIRGHVRRTPLESSSPLTGAAGVPIHLKLECWQPTRSFKVRGAFNAIASLDPAMRARGIVTASAGNHGLAVALAARTLGIRAHIHLPASAPATKRERIRSLDALLHDGGADYDEAERRAAAHAERDGLTFVHAYSDPAVVAGQGTVGLEVLEELPGVREVVVPVGGGGLIGGIGIVIRAMSPGTRVIGVQSTETRAMYEALRAGRVIDVPVPPTLADGLAGATDERSLQLARHVVDDMVLVDETAIARAIRVLHQECGVVAEGSAAVVAAVVLEGTIRLEGPAALIITGSNIDADRLASVLAGGAGGAKG